MTKGNVKFYYFHWSGKGKDAVYEKTALALPWHVWVCSDKKLGAEKIKEMIAIAIEKGKSKCQLEKGTWMCAIVPGTLWDDNSWAEVVLPEVVSSDPGMVWT